jgi:hypothetical protein
MKVSDTQLLTQAISRKNESFVYYTGAVWNKANIITSDTAWFSYLKVYKYKIENPLKIIIE